MPPLAHEPGHLGRRRFILTLGGGLAGLALAESCDVRWPADEAAGPGWAPGLEERLNSTCLVCPSRCGIRGRAVDGRLVGIGGNQLHPLSRGGICPRGAAAVQTLYHPERLRTPLLRVGARGAGRWRSLTPNGALTFLADRLQQLRAAGRPEALAVLAGYCAGSMDAVWRQFLRAFGSPNYVADAYPDGTDAIMAAMHGIPQRPSYDLERAGLVLSFGAPLFEAWWSPLQAYVAFGRPGEERERHPRFIQVDTRFSRTAARAHEWVAVRPRTHAILALGIAYVLIKEERIDADFLARHVAGFDDWLDDRGTLQPGYRSLVLRHYRTEEVSAATGVPIERIVGLAKMVADRGPAVAVCGADVTQAPDGLPAGMAVHSLNVLTGNINRPGGVLFRDEPPLAALPPAALDAMTRRGLARSPVALPAPLGAPNARRLAEEIAATQASPVEVLLLYYANPLASSSDGATWTAALSRVPLVVSFSPFLDETTSQADLVIPDLLPAERWQDGPAPASYPYPVWGIARPLVTSPGGGRSTGDLILALAARLGGTVGASLPYVDFEALLKARARGLYDARRGMPFGDEFETEHQQQMQERGWWLASAPDFEAFWTALVERGGWVDPFYDHTDPTRLARTAGDRIELIPQQLRRQADGAEARDPYRFRTDDDRTADAFPLRLNPYRMSTLASGTVGLAPWLAERPTTFPEVHWIPWVEVHPMTARELGLGDGAMVWVVSIRGRYLAQMKHFAGAARDVVNAPYGLRHPDGTLANPLQLLDGATDPLTDLASWCTTFVRLERA
ncbi:MAG: molybdopterin-dependent oxidoreductase [Gemmatimonadetes bacterium]|nr:molybdopterin-dependent oxidoreductase [Gemmatimonadota bacterium]